MEKFFLPVLFCSPLGLLFSAVQRHAKHSSVKTKKIKKITKPKREVPDSARSVRALQAIELGHTGDLTGSDAISWEVKEATPYVPSPLLYDDKIYVCSVNRAIISCYQAETGKANFVKKTLEGIGEIYASPVGAAGRVYFVGRNGKTQVIKRSEKFELLATNTLDDKFDCSPAIVGNELFLKGKEYLYCIAEL